MAVPERTAAQVKIRIGEAATGAYIAVFGRLGLLLELGWLPLLVMLAVTLVPGVVAFFWPTPADAAAPPFTLEDVVESVAALLCLNAFAARWYQAMLLANGRVVPRQLFLAAWARFIGYTLLFSLPTVAPVAAVMVAGAPSAADDASRIIVGAAALASIAAALLVLRLSLVWPAAADGNPLSWREAWRYMSGNTWRLVGAMLLVYAPILVTAVFIMSVVLAAAHVDIDQLSSHPPLGFVLLQGVIDTVMQFVFVALGAAVLAEFYRRLVRNAPADRSEGP